MSTHFEATIDLHEFTTIHNALEHLERELFLFFEDNKKTIQIIHGIGEGKLAPAVHEALKKNPMVVSREESWDGGSCIIRL